MPQLKKVVFVLLLLLATSPLLQAQKALSLQQAQAYALEHNLNHKNARADARIARKQVWEITASGLPQVNGSISYQYFPDIPTSLVPAEFFGGEPGEFAEIQFGTEQNVTASFTVSQLVFDGSYIIGLQAARIYRDLATQAFQRSEIEVKNSVTQSYYLVLVARENLGIVQANLLNMEKTLFETQKLLEAGFTDPINYDQLRLTVTNMRNAIANLERQEKITHNLLKFQLGMPMDESLELTDSLQGLFQNLSLENLMVKDFSPEQHIEFQLMLSQEKMKLMAMRREWSFYLPNITASYTRQENALRNEFNFLDKGQPWFPTSVIAVNLNIPIFSSGMRASRVQQARLELEKARNNSTQVLQSLLLQQQEARAEFDTAVEKYNNQKETLELAERILHRTRIMFREGMASSLELTQASDQMIATQGSYINAIFELLTAKTKLDKSLGRL